MVLAVAAAVVVVAGGISAWNGGVTGSSWASNSTAGGVGGSEKKLDGKICLNYKNLLCAATAAAATLSLIVNTWRI